MARVLGVSADVLLGVSEQCNPKRIAKNRLERRLLEIDKLDGKAKRQITQLLDSFIEGEKLKQQLNKTASTSTRTRRTSTQEARA